ncbi:MAG: L,D-transpeptidase, partial [Deltaproteobacteria bacterium]|nr:L,D-transpeptidase [Deltaproteobacteria bacterium]
LLDVDLSDEWAPFIFSESDGPDTEVKPNPYRSTFIRLASDRASPEEVLMETTQGALAAMSAAGISLVKGAARTPAGRRAIANARRAVRVQRDRNYLEAYGIPPTLSVLLARIETDREKACYDQVDVEGLAAFEGTVTFQSRKRARSAYRQALSDASWVDKLLASNKAAVDNPTDVPQPSSFDDKLGAEESHNAILAGIAKRRPGSAERIERYWRGRARLRAIRAVQARLVCEGLLTSRMRHEDGLFDWATNQALAAWERKNDISGWGFLGGETLEALQRSPMQLHFDTFRRILMAHVADAAAILEDGSVSGRRRPATYKDADGKEHVVPNLVGDCADGLMAALGVRSIEDAEAFLRQVGRERLAGMHVAFRAPPLPPYYSESMDLSVLIDRGDVWYDVPFDEDGNLVPHPRRRFPTLTVFAHWRDQRIPLVRWRTTIGSWRGETDADGKVYLRYKNSDVGPCVWKEIVASPVWIPPDTTPPRALVTRKRFDRNKGPATVVNTDLMGPGFQSAFGLVEAIHHRVVGDKLYDNGIRTHGSVDYTSIARRYSHGCHRLVNSRAVRLFDFILQRRPFERAGNQAMWLRKSFTYEDKEYVYVIDTRGYYYELTEPVPVLVTRGRIRGKVRRPIQEYLQKPGVEYDETGQAKADEGEAEHGDEQSDSSTESEDVELDPRQVPDEDAP